MTEWRNWQALPNSDLTRIGFEEFWDQLAKKAGKEPQFAYAELVDFYGQLNEDDRPVVAIALTEWVSGNDSLRASVAEDIISEFEIYTALPAIRGELAVVNGHKEKLERIVATLEQLGSET